MMSFETAHEPTALYRIYDAKDRLIYIGQSQRMGARMKTHAAHSWWFELMHRIEIEYRPNRLSGMAAEAVAIQEEQPRFNVRHTGRKETDWSHLTDDELAVARRWLDDDEHPRHRMPRFLWYRLAGYVPQRLADIPLAS